MTVFAFLNKPWFRDAAERVGSTFAEAFIGVFGLQGLIALSGGNWHTALDLGRAGAAAGAAAVLAVVKTWIASRKKGTLSPASLASATPSPVKDAGLTALGVLLIVLIVLVALSLGVAVHPLWLLLLLLIALVLIF